MGFPEIFTFRKPIPSIAAEKSFSLRMNSPESDAQERYSKYNALAAVRARSSRTQRSSKKLFSQSSR